MLFSQPSRSIPWSNGDSVPGLIPRVTTADVGHRNSAHSLVNCFTCRGRLAVRRWLRRIRRLSVIGWLKNSASLALRTAETLTDARWFFFCTLAILRTSQKPVRLGAGAEKCHEVVTEAAIDSGRSPAYLGRGDCHNPRSRSGRIHRHHRQYREPIVELL